jgi:hypothetical protein
MGAGDREIRCAPARPGEANEQGKRQQRDIPQRHSGGTADTHDNPRVEVGLTGRDGLVGASVMLNPEPYSVHRAFTQVQGGAYRMSNAAFRSAVDQSATLRAIVAPRVVSSGSLKAKAISRSASGRAAFSAATHTP